jgi:hypothetical protein
MGKLGTAIAENQGSSDTRAGSGVARMFAVFILGLFFLRAEAQIVMLRLERAT